LRSSFDRRVVSEDVLEFVRACQHAAVCRLGGGVALAGVYLSHRRTGDVDLLCPTAGDQRALAQVLPGVAAEVGGSVQVLRDAGTLVRARLQVGTETVELDVVHDGAEQVEEAPPAIEGVVVESLADLRASKLTCLLSRSEPRDLVDVLFLQRAGHPPERDLHLALRKDAGIDPAILAWLLRQFPVEPLPQMLEPLAADELVAFRDDLAERFRRLAVC